MVLDIVSDTYIVLNRHTSPYLNTGSPSLRQNTGTIPYVCHNQNLLAWPKTELLMQYYMQSSSARPQTEFPKQGFMLWRPSSNEESTSTSKSLRPNPHPIPCYMLFPCKTVDQPLSQLPIYIKEIWGHNPQQAKLLKV